jgi:hypothetical protein
LKQKAIKKENKMEQEENEKLENYGDTYSKMLTEGDGYYFYGYESEENFDFDEELKVKFIEARDSVESFKQLLESKIINEGGNPEDYEI